MGANLSEPRRGAQGGCPGTVFGLPREAPAEHVARRYAELFGRHAGDGVVG